MKKKLLCIALCATMLVPNYVIALPESDEVASVETKSESISDSDTTVDEKSPEDVKLEKAILSAKKKLGISDDYEEFDYDTDTVNGTSIYYMNWSGSETSPTVSATVSEDGYVYTYDKYVDYDYSETVIPDLTKSDAIDVAFEYVTKLVPEFKSSIDKNFVDISYSRSGCYTLKLHRVANGETVNGNYINVTVNHDGEVTYFNLKYFDRNVKSVEKGNKIPVDKAYSNLAKSLENKLIYRSVYDDDGNASIVLQYELDSSYSTLAVGALNGKTLNFEYRSGMSDFKEEILYMDSAQTMNGVAEDGKLSEAEQKAVTKQKELLSEEKAEKIISAMNAFEFDEKLELIGSYLYSSKSVYTGKDEYKLRLTYKNPDDFQYVWVIFDAVSGKVLNYSYSGDVVYKTPSEFKYSKEDCLKTIEKFLATHYSRFVEEYTLEETETPPAIILKNAEEENISSYSFRFSRYVNGIHFPDDYIFISVNPDTLNIVDFSLQNTDANFPSPDGIISDSEAKTNLVNALEPKSNYVVVNKGEKTEDGKFIITNDIFADQDKELLLVYSVDYAYYVDAFTGDVVDYSNEPYEKSSHSYFTKIAFSDIGKTPYENAINKLFDMDIIYNDSKFRPERSITQGEFMEMLKGINPSLYRKYVRIAEGSRDEQFPLDIDNINPEATLTNEQATVFFVEMLGYSDIATIENIFKCDFKDADKISSEFYGFVALCKGLGILDDFKENFSPQSDLTRGNAALMIYNYLDR